MQNDYDPRQIEVAAQAYWEQNQSFKAEEDPAREKFYCLSMFPYPSGRLHMGHVRNYTIGDVIARYQRMLGKNVLQPMGWDAFGLPAENAAIKHGIPPSQWTESNIAYMKDQLKRLGFGYDWDRELATCDPDYYRWEQWLFTRLMEKGLAYRAKATVNWDPVDQTVLANEQVIDGKGWRSGAPVEKREIEQWFVRITDYAQELLDALDSLDGWPEQVRTMQRNWIGRSEGVYMEFGIEGSDETLGIYTTRPDTVMGVTYVAVAAEHPLARQAAESRSGARRLRRGMPPGRDLRGRDRDHGEEGPRPRHRRHPPDHRRAGAHLRRQLRAHGLRHRCGDGGARPRPARLGVRRALRDPETAGDPCRGRQARAASRRLRLWRGACCATRGRSTGMTSEQAFGAIADWLSERGKGGKRVNFRLRDWGVSRQRYWGCPVPVIDTPDGGVRAETDLPVRLPEDVVVDGSGSPLKNMPEFSDLGNGETRETDTFDTFFESSWYYARYCSSDCDTAMLDERANYWLPVDQYVGGIEHAVLHLLYARFFHKLMRDEGLVDCDEPFTRLLTQGMVVAETYYREDADGRKHWYNPADVEVERDEKGRLVSAVLREDGAAGHLRRHREDVQVQEQRRRSPDPDGSLRRRHGASLHHVHRRRRISRWNGTTRAWRGPRASSSACGPWRTSAVSIRVAMPAIPALGEAEQSPAGRSTRPSRRPCSTTSASSSTRWSPAA